MASGVRQQGERVEEIGEGATMKQRRQRGVWLAGIGWRWWAAKGEGQQGYGRLEAGAIREKGEMVAGGSSREGRRGNSDGSDSKR
ncbi:hypothetical protein B296_00024565 [Ensete ventricosum]|uniref:Uncharacterized protein n=1 Tax=Ensete ventricosum TaxID=4639 RepID=A0A426YYB0_ENSVE|nr:hypothetical protein B296_00024565 [Ensete ventricosum]